MLIPQLDRGDGSAMSNKGLFEREFQILEKSKAELAAAEGLDRESHATLVAEYAKLLRQTRKLTAISDRQQMELRTLNELKNKFLGMAAHDLRNPCGVVRGFSELILMSDNMPAEKQKLYIGYIKDASDHMLNLLSDLLDISVIESGKLTMNPSEADLGEMVAKKVHLMTMVADKKGIKIETRIVETPRRVFDADRLGQVLDNLLTNAIKFSSAGSMVTVSTFVSGHEVGFSVADQGPGISEQDQEKLFGTFQRLENRPTGGEKSTGLGLSIVKKIVQAHGGRITVDSTLGQGTTFRVFIPEKS